MAAIPERLWIKGPPKTRWIRHKELVEFIFTQLFPNWSAYCADSAIRAGVSKSTLYDWKAQYMKDVTWRPYKTNRLQDKRIFTDKEESHIADHILEVYIARGIYFTDDDFLKVAADFLLKKSGHGFPNFTRALARGFKRRRRFVSRLAHNKRRPTVTSDDMKSWHRTIGKILATVPHDHVINVDETCSRAMPNNLRSWALRGSENV